MRGRCHQQGEKASGDKGCPPLGRPPPGVQPGCGIGSGSERLGGQQPAFPAAPEEDEKATRVRGWGSERLLSDPCQMAMALGTATSWGRLVRVSSGTLRALPQFNKSLPLCLGSPISLHRGFSFYVLV